MKRALLFVTMCFAGGIGAVLGGLVGQAAGRGGLLFGGLVGGVALVVVAAYVSERLGWITRAQRLWAMLGGVFGFLLAYMVGLSTLSTVVGPILGTLLIGTGAVLGAIVGHSAHEKHLDPSRAR